MEGERGERQRDGGREEERERQTEKIRTPDAKHTPPPLVYGVSNRKASGK